MTKPTVSMHRRK